MLTIIEILKLIEKNFILIGIVLLVSYILYSVALYYLFEKIGVNKSLELIDNSDLILYVLNSLTNIILSLDTISSFFESKIFVNPYNY